ncbi:DUF6498-containing protein [Falsiroseomonas oryzae]|uniref:DUF6498-containing protein n=1 Tax=Falsiroseomonas oryzae TaxID=2766473 RepID=UPI0022EB5B73|nr:DUF6498-containing protein [Roseomonas sp. MO-31]
MRGALPPLALSTAALVLANALPLAGALLGMWSAYELLLLFWAENVVIGVFQVLRMASTAVLRRDVAAAALMPFFVFHYGIFAFVHGQFVAGVLAPPDARGLDAAVALLLSPDGLLWALLALAASHGFSFVVNFLGAGEWRGIEPRALMMQPYTRVVLLHLVILGGGAATMALGEPIAAVVALVVIKIVLDIAAHRREHGGARRAA